MVIVLFRVEAEELVNLNSVKNCKKFNFINELRESRVREKTW
jgi:hypothetical protein